MLWVNRRLPAPHLNCRHLSWLWEKTVALGWVPGRSWSLLWVAPAPRWGLLCPWQSYLWGSSRWHWEKVTCSHFPHQITVWWEVEEVEINVGSWPRQRLMLASGLGREVGSEGAGLVWNDRPSRVAERTKGRARIVIGDLFVGGVDRSSLWAVYLGDGKGPALYCLVVLRPATDHLVAASCLCHLFLCFFLKSTLLKINSYHTFWWVLTNLYTLEPSAHSILRIFPSPPKLLLPSTVL